MPYKSPIVARKDFLVDLNEKASPFYIREKVEVSVVADRVAGSGLRYTIIFILILYMYGAICLKYVSGAKSFNVGIAYTFWDSEEAF